MGDTSIIARRLKDNRVQYGSCGSDGYYANLGQSLSEWYLEPDTVEYLFRLGQLKSLGVPGSEKGGYSIYYTHELTGRPHFSGASEQEIFSRTEGVRYGYFYDLDNQWYYVMPGSFRLKVPLKLIASNLDARGYEFAFRSSLERQLVEYLLGGYAETDERFRELLTNNSYGREELLCIILREEDPLKKFCEYPKVSKYFDQWVVAVPDADCRAVDRFLVRPAEEGHVETNLWS